ncbi:MAG: Mut7-C RNAse domain-containing protein [Nitrososphaerales archaeon]
MAHYSEKKFLVDGMLGSIARKLRILGFDTIYELQLGDRELLENARDSGRILLTSDSELFYRAKRNYTASIRVTSKTEIGRLYEVLSGVGENRINLTSITSRCSACNGELLDSEKSLAERTVLVCRCCGKNYWRGGHWKKLTKVFSEVNQMLGDRKEAK